MKNRPEMSSATPRDLDENALILHYYGESADPEAVAKALASDAALRQRYAALARDLAAAAVETPEPPADLAARVWRELRPQLERKRSWRDRLLAGFSAGPWQPGAGWGPQWTLAAVSFALVAALGIGYLAGRRETPAAAAGSAATAVTAATGLSTAARERLLLASVEGHLAGSERLLTRVANAAPADAAALAEESAWAEALVSSNRLYRRAALRSGQRRIAALLDELEPLLLELANSAGAAPDDLATAQRRIENTDLLFKLRVTGERLQRDAGASRSMKQTANRTVS